MTIHLASSSLSYFNPRPPRGGRRQFPCRAKFCQRISIHAPREGGDLCGGSFLLRLLQISIHAPREGGDSGKPTLKTYDLVISIHAPREGGDFVILSIFFRPPNFNPRPPRGGRPRVWGGDGHLLQISIHAPREGGDLNFLVYAANDILISIHAPREGGDSFITSRNSTHAISIHAPREGGDGVSVEANLDTLGISIHAPREGGDFCGYGS